MTVLRAAFLLCAIFLGYGWNHYAFGITEDLTCAGQLRNSSRHSDPNATTNIDLRYPPEIDSVGDTLAGTGYKIINDEPDFDESSASKIKIVERLFDNALFVLKISQGEDLNDSASWEYHVTHKVLEFATQHQIKASYFLNVQKIQVVHLGKNQTWLLVPLVNAKSLRRHLLDGTTHTWTLENKVRIARQILEAVELLHGAGFIHRDLKPEQILVDENFRVTILDLGLTAPLNGFAKTHREPNGELTTPDSLRFAGTPIYIERGQRHGHPAEEKQDLEPLHKILFELFTGLSLTLDQNIIHPQFEVLTHIEKVIFPPQGTKKNYLNRFTVAPENFYGVPEMLAIAIFSKLPNSIPEMRLLFELAIKDGKDASQNFYNLYTQYLLGKMSQEAQKATESMTIFETETIRYWVSSQAMEDVLSCAGVVERLDNLISYSQMQSLILGYFYLEREIRAAEAQNGIVDIDKPSARLHLSKFRTKLNYLQSDWGFPPDSFYLEILQRLKPPKNKRLRLLDLFK